MNNPNIPSSQLDSQAGFNGPDAAISVTRPNRAFKGVILAHRTPTMIPWRACIAAVIFVILTIQAFGSPIEEARAVFKKMVDLERKFDPAVADLYADDAIIQNTRRYPYGIKKTRAMPGLAYKPLIRLVMPLAKTRGDTSRYSNVTFKEQDGKVHIKATRYSELKKYSSPVSLVIATMKTKTGNRWLIVKEVSEWL